MCRCHLVIIILFLLHYLYSDHRCWLKPSMAILLQTTEIDEKSLPKELYQVSRGIPRGAKADLEQICETTAARNGRREYCRKRVRETEGYTDCSKYPFIPARYLSVLSSTVTHLLLKQPLETPFFVLLLQMCSDISCLDTGSWERQP